jgi:threonyl-tRNA synthetase
MDAVKAAVEGVKDLAISIDNTEAPKDSAAAPVASSEQRANKPQKQQQPKGEKKEKKAKKGADSGDGRPLELSPPAPFIDHRVQIL